MTFSQPDRLCYSINEAAKLVGVCKRTIYNEISAGRLRKMKLARRALIPADALREWIDAASKPAGARGRR